MWVWFVLRCCLICDVSFVLLGYFVDCEVGGCVYFVCCGYVVVFDLVIITGSFLVLGFLFDCGCFNSVVWLWFVRFALFFVGLLLLVVWCLLVTLIWVVCYNSVAMIIVFIFMVIQLIRFLCFVCCLLLLLVFVFVDFWLLFVLVDTAMFSLRWFCICCVYLFLVISGGCLRLISLVGYLFGLWDLIFVFMGTYVMLVFCLFCLYCCLGLLFVVFGCFFKCVILCV